MYDRNGIIKNNVLPFKESDHRKMFLELYELVETELDKAGIKWISYNKNLCW